MARSSAFLFLPLLPFLSALMASRTAAALPNGYAYGCLPGNVSSGLPFCDASLPLFSRVQDLVTRLSLKEKILLLGGDGVNTGVGMCNGMDGGILRLGVPHYMHLVETNSGINSACLGSNKCTTIFPGPTGLGAAFNRTLWHLKGEVMSTEMRALNNLVGG